MGIVRSRSLLAGACILVAQGMLLGQEPVRDQDVPGIDSKSGITEPAVAGEDRIGVSIGYDYSSHFMLYGLDVWGGGDDFFGSESTNFVWADVAVDLEPFTINFGAWSDINDNAESGLGGSIQEVDVYIGLAYTIDRFTLGATYQQWYYASEEEGILDLSVAFDDSDLLVEGFALNPSLLAHMRVDANGAQEEATAYVLAIEPAFQLNDGDYPLTLSIPVSVAYFEEDFYGGDSGYAYTSVGATLSVPLAFIPADYGAWSVAANVTYYMTEEDVIPGNPEENFLAGMVSVNVSF